MTLPFEKSLERLEKIVQDLENGDVSLEDALKKYEEGIRLSRACQQQLAEAEKKIEVLSRQPDGSYKKEPFEVTEEENGKTVKKSSRRVSRKSAPEQNEGSEDEDLLI